MWLCRSTAGASAEDSWLFVLLTVVAAAAQVFPVSAPGRQAYHVSPPFFLTAVLLLSAWHLVLLLAIVHVAEWLWLRRRRSWFVQVFNAAALVITGLLVQGVYRWLWPSLGSETISLGDPRSLIGAGVAIVVYASLNASLTSLAIWLGNGIPPREQQIFERERITTDVILLLMGIPVAYIALASAWSLTLAAVPLVLIHRALDLPNVRAKRDEDALTQLSGSATLGQACRRELERAGRFGTSLALLVLDLDHLAAVNADFGYTAGDAVIEGTARLLSRATRGYDVPARLEGGTLAVLLPQVSEQEARQIAERVRQELAKWRHEFASSVEQIVVTCSIGVAIAADESGSVDHLFAVAEAALREAQREGGDGVCVKHTSSIAFLPASSVDLGGELAPPGPATNPVATLPAPNGAVPSRRVHLVLPVAVRRWAPALVTISVIVPAAAIVAVVGPHVPSVDPIALLFLLGLVALVESRSMELFSRSTFSISTVPILAVGPLLGLPGAIIVAPVAVLVRGLLRRSPWYKVLFNSSTHIVAGAGAAAIYDWIGLGLQPENILILGGVALIAGGTFYLLNTALTALAIAAELRVSPLEVWTENFRWLGPQYLALGAMGLLLALAYKAFGITGAAAFVIPPLMMQLVAKQYVGRTLANVRQLRTLNEKLEHQAFHDPLTGLANRALFLDRVEHALARRGGSPVAVLFLDLDNFKVVNDSLGHPAGDSLLIATTERLRGCLRPQDTIARLGGDEFTVLLEDLLHPDEAMLTAERIRGQLLESFLLDGRQVVIGASIGVTLAHAGEQQRANDLLREADVAMYRAKTNGRGRIEVFDASMALRAADRFELETDLRGAAERGELVLHYQPIVELATGRIAEVEALLRWNHPRRGMIPPDSFIPLAEETYLIVPVGRWVLAEACRQVVEFHAAWPSEPPLVLSVNLSGRQIEDPRLADIVREVLDETGLAPENLKLEITETVAMRDADTTVRTLNELRSLGIRLAIDDFGTGYSSLAQLHRFPIDSLKIDRSFVARLGDGRDGGVVRTIIALAQTLKLVVTAEGIETAEQQQLLLLEGCEQGQGYYLARPQPAQSLDALLGAAYRTTDDLAIAA